MFQKIIIDGIETNYSVSEKGEVKNDCTQRPIAINGGAIQISVNKKSRRLSLGKIVAEIFIPKENEEQVCVIHLDGNVNNNSVENLRWITAKENSNNIWKKRRENGTTGAGVKREIKKRENIVEVKKYDLNEDEERQIIIDNELTYYSINKLGQVKNLNTKKFLKGTNLHSYIYVNLTVGKKRKNRAVHQLVAQAFLPNPNNYIIVDHINGNKHDNRLVNLEQVTSKENSRKAATETNAWGFRQVGEYDDKGNLLQIYPNASEAARAVGILPSSMRNSIRREGKCSNGLRYKYIENK